MKYIKIHFLCRQQLSQELQHREGVTTLKSGGDTEQLKEVEKMLEETVGRRDGTQKQLKILENQLQEKFSQLKKFGK